MLSRFNLSEWALAHRSFVLYLMLAVAFIGFGSYGKLGQSEDPPFTFKVMVVRSEWPGATAREVEQQLTEPLEKKLQETPHLDYLQSYSKPGESLIFLMLKDSSPPSEVPDAWYQVRKKVGDIRGLLPAGVRGPYFNDEFGDTFGNIYALVGDGYSDGYSDGQRRDFAEQVRIALLRVPDVAKVELFGLQDEKVYVDVSNNKLATLGLDPQAVADILRRQNAMVPAGEFETSVERVFLRASGGYDSVESIAATTFRANGRVFRLGDIADIHRGYADPANPRMRFQGRDAVGVGVSMRKGGDIIDLGRHLDDAVKQVQAALPAGMELHVVASQPRAVSASVSEFVRSLSEAVIIVLVVSFFSLGLRTGLVVALSIPLVLAATFFFMRLFDIGLHKISLGALILSLGLLVDDAIIAVEMMAVKMEQGWDRVKAASFAFTSTAFPMLSGTLVTAAGFLPIATAASATGEYTRSIFQVTVIALLLSWLAAVIFIPYLGYRLLPNFTGGMVHDESQVYGKSFYRRFRALVTACVRHRRLTLAATAALFVLSVLGFGLVQQQFFPDSTRPELIVDLRLTEGASRQATDVQVKKLESLLAHDANVENVVAYVGNGSPRFYLPLDQQLPSENFAEVVVLAKGLKEREAIRTKLIRAFDEDFPEVRAIISRMENGPPVGFPVRFRVSGDDIGAIRSVATQVADVMRRNPHLSNVHMDWDEDSKVVRLDIDQAKARLLGFTTAEISTYLQAALRGMTASYYRERDQQIEIVLRGAEAERTRLSQLEHLVITNPAGRGVPLAQLAKISYDFEPGVIWRRNRLPTITVRANLYGKLQAPTVTGQILPQLEPIKAKLPPGVTIETGGAVEESAKGGASVAAGIPLFIFTVLTVLMIQLQSMSRTALVVLTAPLGLIGVTLFLLIFNVPFGFVAMLGTIALSGMIMRNSVILVDQIDHDIRDGKRPFEAIIDATVRRFRPIVLTAAAAILAMIPLTRSTFFAPMAVAIMGGLLVATVLTLLFLPALYAAWFRVREEP